MPDSFESCFARMKLVPRQNKTTGGYTYLWVAVALGIYVGLWILVNIAPSGHHLSYALAKVRGIFNGEHSFEGYLFGLLVIGAVVAQIKVWKRPFEEDLSPWDPVSWPGWLGLCSAVIAFFVGVVILIYSRAGEFLSEFSDGGIFLLLIGIVVGLISLIVVGLLFAAGIGIAVALYLSLILYFPVISLFNGIIVCLAQFFEYGEFNLLLMYTNFLDAISVLGESSQSWIAVFALITSAAAAIYRTANSFEALDFG